MSLNKQVKLNLIQYGDIMNLWKGWLNRRFFVNSYIIQEKTLGYKNITLSIVKENFDIQDFCRKENMSYSTNCLRVIVKVYF